jgi:hypothetical protein
MSLCLVMAIVISAAMIAIPVVIVLYPATFSVPVSAVITSPFIARGNPSR